MNILLQGGYGGLSQLKRSKNRQKSIHAPGGVHIRYCGHIDDHRLFGLLAGHILKLEQSLNGERSGQLHNSCARGAVEKLNAEVLWGGIHRLSITVTGDTLVFCEHTMTVPLHLRDGRGAGCRRQQERESGPLAQLAFDADGAVHPFDHVLDDRQA
jgi:hypothetical protein